MVGCCGLFGSMFSKSDGARVEGHRGAMGSRSYGRVRLMQLFDEADSVACRKKCLVTLAISLDNRFVCLLGEKEGSELKRMAVDAVSAILVTPRTLALQQREGMLKESTSVLHFDHAKEASEFVTALRMCQSMKTPSSHSPSSTNGADLAGLSVFDARTEHASASQYFQFYGYLSQQQNMMQDYVRTSTYQRAIHVNAKDFKDKVVLDVGAGSGILSFFAAQAGARKVYAVEASSIAVHCAELVRVNHLSERIIVVPGRIEEVTLPEQVDVIISEPMGYMLVNERMLESYIHSRKFLKPGVCKRKRVLEGVMFPSRGDLHAALFNDESLYLEQCSKANFWCQENFHGVNVSPLRPQALIEIFKQPVVDTWHVNCLVSGSVKWSIDFERDPESKLHKVEIPFDLAVNRSGHVHGIAFWFDVAFIGSTETVWLSTAPTEPLTHWYQVRCLFEKPLMAFTGQIVSGSIVMVANERQSYDVDVVAEVGGAQVCNSLDLKNPLFRYNGAAIMPSSSCTNESPSDALLQQNGVLGSAMDVPMEGMINGLASAYNGSAVVSASHSTTAHSLAGGAAGIPPPPTITNTDIIDIPPDVCSCGAYHDELPGIALTLN